MVLLRIVLTFWAALGWWGALYPELVLTADTYRIVDEGGREVEEDAEAEEIYRTFLCGDRSRVRLRSRLLMNLTALWEQGRGNDDTE